MNDNTRKTRWLSALATGTIFSVILGILACRQGDPSSLLRQTELTAAEKEKENPIALWGGSVERNLVNLVDKNIPSDWSITTGKEKNVLWSCNLGSKAYGGPIISGGKIFVGTNNKRPRNKSTEELKKDKGIIMCFRESDGEFLWQLVHDKLEGGRVNDWPEEGICSSPVVQGNRIYYVSNRCEVICATTEGMVNGKNVGPFKEEQYTSKIDGDIVWKLDMIKDLGVFPHNLATCSPLLVGDILFVITSNGVDERHLRIPAPNAPSFLAIDKHTGKVLWQDKSPGKNIMHGQWSNPVYTVAKGVPQIIFPGGDGWIYAFSPKKHELLWKFDCNPKGAKYRLGAEGTKNDFVSTPIISDNKLYIAVGQDPEHKKSVGHMWCIDITKKPKDDKSKDLSPYSSEDDEAPNKFDPKDPKNKDSGLVWHYGGKKDKVENDEERPYFFGRSMSTCAVDKGLCYVGDFDGYLYCFDAATGKKHWEFETEDETWSSPYLVDGKVFFGNDGGAIHIFEHSSKQKLIKKVQMKGKVRVTPVAANGVLYVATENPCKLYAIKAK